MSASDGGNAPHQPFAMSVSPSGKLVAMKRHSCISVSTLDLTTQPSPTTHSQWSLPVPDPQQLGVKLSAEFAWSSDERNIAVKYTPQQDVGLLLALARFGLTQWHLPHIVHIPARSLQVVTARPDFDRGGHLMLLGYPAFSPNGTFLLVPWSRCDSASRA